MNVAAYNNHRFFQRVSARMNDGVFAVAAGAASAETVKATETKKTKTRSMGKRGL